MWISLSFLGTHGARCLIAEALEDETKGALVETDIPESLTVVDEQLRVWEPVFQPIRLFDLESPVLHWLVTDGPKCSGSAGENTVGLSPKSSTS